MFFTFLAVSGCGEGTEEPPAAEPDPAETEVPREVQEMYGETAPIDPELSEDEFIDYVARIQLLQRDYQDKYSHALEEGDMEEAERVQSEFESEADEIMDEMGISEREVEEFERANPQFFQDPDTQRRVMERIEELSQQ